MPLSSAAPSLENDIKNAYLTARNNASVSKKVSDVIISELALQISRAIHSYTSQATVTTQDNIDAGQIDLPGSGITTANGTGTGNGSLL